MRVVFIRIVVVVVSKKLEQRKREFKSREKKIKINSVHAGVIFFFGSHTKILFFVFVFLFATGETQEPRSKTHKRRRKNAFK